MKKVNFKFRKRCGFRSYVVESHHLSSAETPVQQMSEGCSENPGSREETRKMITFNWPPESPLIVIRPKKASYFYYFSKHTCRGDRICVIMEEMAPPKHKPHAFCLANMGGKETIQSKSTRQRQAAALRRKIHSDGRRGSR